MLRIPVMAHVRLAEDASYVQSLEAGARELPVVVCVSYFIQSLFEVRSLDSQRRLVVLYDPYLPQRPWMDSSTHGTSTPEPVFSCVGRLTRIKGQDVALRAIGHLKRKGRPVHGLFFGAGESGDRFSLDLAELAAKLGIADQVSWQGFQEKIPRRIAPTAALICPSHTEPLGRVIFEAWDAGTIPVAWAGSGGPAEVIQASGAGLLYDEQNGASLAQTLERVLSLTPSDRKRMVERGRQWLLKNCDPEEYGQQMLAVWQDAVDR
ncbi:MAG: glycosyltransferase [Anaerolineae bacterium]|nr:glycosyltransferase [Anaerolineae bacterium]